MMITASATSGGLSVAVNGGTLQTMPVNTVMTIFLQSPYDGVQFGVNAPAHIQWIGK